MVKSLSEYLGEVRKITTKLKLDNTTTTAWFRGQGNGKWKLIPSIFRYDHLQEYERDINRDFKLLSKTLIKSNQPDNEFDWLYLMQHYDLPTRLLDWTESSLVGLYFAVSNLEIEENSVVWVLSPRNFNWLVLEDTNTVPVSSSTYLSNYILKPDDGSITYREVEALYPLAIRPAKNSARILAQRGVFTIHGKEKVCLADFVKKKNTRNLPVLEKIEVDKKSKLSILKELFQAGISPSVVFPELPGISKELIMRYTKFYTYSL